MCCLQYVSQAPALSPGVTGKLPTTFTLIPSNPTVSLINGGSGRVIKVYKAVS